MRKLEFLELSGILFICLFVLLLFGFGFLFVLLLFSFSYFYVKMRNHWGGEYKIKSTCLCFRGKTRMKHA